MKEASARGAHTQKKKTEKQRQRFPRQVCHPFPFFPLHNRFLVWLFPMSLWMYKYI